MDRYNHVMSILITDYMDGQQQAAGLADYVRDLKASHDALLDYVKQCRAQIHWVSDEKLQPMTDIIANAENLT